MPKPVSLQLYTLRDEVKKQGLAPVVKLVADIGYKGVELAGLQGHTPQQFKQLLDEFGLKPVGAHVDLLNPGAAQQIVDEAKAIGYRHIIKSLPKDDFLTGGEAAVRKLAEKANEAVARFEPHGLQVSFHNHWWEFKDPKLGALMLELCPKAGLQNDIYWIQTSGQDPAALIEKYAKRTYILHVKDGPCEVDPPMTAVGQGKVDIKACLAAAEKSACEWYSVELDRCATDMVQAVKDSYAYLIGNKLAAGNK